MKAKKIKEILQNALEAMEDFDDDMDVSMESNTYFISRQGSSIFLGTNSGYLALEPHLLEEILFESETEDDDEQVAG